MSATRPDVVLDCNVFVQAVSRRHGPAAAVLRLVEENVITLHVSKAVLQELRLTLTYAEIRDRNPHLTDAVVDAFLGRILFRARMARDVPRVFRYARDPNDEPYVDLAATVGAEWLITRDNDLLCLMSDHSVDAKEFRQRFRRLRVVDPVEFLRVMTSE